MGHDPAVWRVLRQHMNDPSTSFSVGSFGAIAEFHRAVDEPFVLDDPTRLTVATTRGALRIQMNDSVAPLAYETLSRRAGHWQHGIVFCLPKGLAQSCARRVLTELGPDRQAVLEKDRDAILFDMGLGARNVDFCIRCTDGDLISVLRANEGLSLFNPKNDAMQAILERSPSRISVSKLGRIEVYQAIPKEKTPEGPHTHVLPKFLKSGRTHSANIPVPGSLLPCLSLHPANPLSDSQGHARPFDEEGFTAFEALFDLWGREDFRVQKAQAIEAVHAGIEPGDYPEPRTRLGRTALRVALRQLRQLEGESAALTRWLSRFDASHMRTQARAGQAPNGRPR